MKRLLYFAQFRYNHSWKGTKSRMSHLNQLLLSLYYMLLLVGLVESSKTKHEERAITSLSLGNLTDPTENLLNTTIPNPWPFRTSRCTFSISYPISGSHGGYYPFTTVMGGAFELSLDAWYSVSSTFPPFFSPRKIQCGIAPSLLLVMDFPSTSAGRRTVWILYLILP